MTQCGCVRMQPSCARVLCLPSVCVLYGGCSQWWGCFPEWLMHGNTCWSWGERKAELELMRATESHPATTRRQELISSVILFTEQEAERCSAVILTTGSAVLCYYPCFTFEEVKMGLIKTLQSRNGSSGCGGHCLPRHWTLPFNTNKERPAPRGWHIAPFSLKSLMPFQ